MDKTLEEIRKAEKEAETIIQKAEEEAQQIILKANQDAEALVEKTKAKIGTQQVKIDEKLQETLKKQRVQAVKKGKEQTSTLAKSAKKKEAKAVDYLLKEFTRTVEE